MEYNHHSGTATTTATTTPRPGTPDSDPIAQAPPNPFTSPYGSIPVSTTGSSTGVQAAQPPRYFHSRRIKKGETERPWLNQKDPREKWVTIIPIIGLLVGLSITGFLVYDGLKSVQNYKYCTVLDEDFSEGLNPKVWTKEVELGGFGYVSEHRIIRSGSNPVAAMESFKKRLVRMRTCLFKTTC